MWSVVLDVRPEVSEMIPLAVIEPPLVSEVLLGGRSIREPPGQYAADTGREKDSRGTDESGHLPPPRCPDEVLDGLFVVG